MEKTSKTNIKKKKNISPTQNPFQSTFFASILKFNIAVALFFLFAFTVIAGDVIVENGKINVDSRVVRSWKL